MELIKKKKKSIMQITSVLISGLSYMAYLNIIMLTLCLCIYVNLF